MSEMLEFKQASVDWSNASQSWTRTSVWTWDSRLGAARTEACPAGTVRVEVRANAYENQSHARISVWHDGWQFYDAVPTSVWYSRMPSYVKKIDTFEDRHYAAYSDLEHDLLTRLAVGLFQTTAFTLEYVGDR